MKDLFNLRRKLLGPQPKTPTPPTGSLTKRVRKRPSKAKSKKAPGHQRPVESKADALVRYHQQPVADVEMGHQQSIGTRADIEARYHHQMEARADIEVRHHPSTSAAAQYQHQTETESDGVIRYHHQLQTNNETRQAQQVIRYPNQQAGNSVEVEPAQQEEVRYEQEIGIRPDGDVSYGEQVEATPGREYQRQQVEIIADEEIRNLGEN